MPCSRGLPLLLVEDEAAVELLLDLGAHVVRQIGVEFLGRDLAIAVRVKRPEHGEIHLGLVPLALLEANRSEGALELGDGQVAIVVHVELTEELCQIPCGGLGLVRQ